VAVEIVGACGRTVICGDDGGIGGLDGEESK